MTGVDYVLYSQTVVDIVNTRMHHDEVAELDTFVQRGLYSSRTEAIRDAVNRLISSIREADLVESHRRAYADDSPVDDSVVIAAGRRAYRRMVENDE